MRSLVDEVTALRAKTERLELACEHQGLRDAASRLYDARLRLSEALRALALAAETGAPVAPRTSEARPEHTCNASQNTTDGSVPPPCPACVPPAIQSLGSYAIRGVASPNDAPAAAALGIDALGTPDLADRVNDVKAWALSRIRTCREQETKFAGAWKHREKHHTGPPQALVEAWTERRALQAVLKMLSPG